jgi:hypothetical protein
MYRSAPFSVPWDKTPARGRICSLNGSRKSEKTVRKPECMFFFLTEIALSILGPFMSKFNYVTNMGRTYRGTKNGALC